MKNEKNTIYSGSNNSHICCFKRSLRLIDWRITDDRVIYTFALLNTKFWYMKRKTPRSPIDVV